MRNKSPWIEQLNQDVSYPPLDHDISTDVVIVGAGISGVMTAFQILRQTDLSVVLLDAQKIARGATGHNAGQVALYFEKPFSTIVEEYSLDMAIA